jgi:hypothetical protein
MGVRRSATVLTVLVSLVLASCGGQSETATDGPARVVPLKGTLVYGEATVRPGGDRAAGIRAALKKVSLRDDVLDLLVEKMDGSFADNGRQLTFKRDIEPWLGRRAGIFLLDFSAEPDIAVVLEVGDEAAAEAALTRIRTAAARDRGDAALVDGFMVIGTTRAVEAAVTASKGGSLAESDDYAAALSPLDADRLGHVWVDLRGALAALPGPIRNDPAVKRIGDAAAASDTGSVALGFDVRTDRIQVEIGGEAELLRRAGMLAEGKDTSASPLLGDLPADAWLAMGIAGGGKLFGQGLADGMAGVSGGAGLAREIEQMTGVDLQKDLLDKVGDLGFYASGTSLTSLGAGAILTGDGPAIIGALQKLTRAVPGVTVEVKGADELVVRLHDAPFSVQARREDDRVAAGLGGTGADRLLDPEDRLKDSDAMKSARDALGDGFELGALVRFGPMVELIGSLAGDDADWARIKPYLVAYDQLVMGDRKKGDAVVSRIVAKLK